MALSTRWTTLRVGRYDVGLRLMPRHKGVRPMFKSWRAYFDFAKGITFDRRYVRSADDDQFLNAVLATTSERKVDVPNGYIFWRA